MGDMYLIRPVAGPTRKGSSQGAAKEKKSGLDSAAHLRYQGRVIWHQGRVIWHQGRVICSEDTGVTPDLLSTQA
jgi:hypothetical protein